MLGYTVDFSTKAGNSRFVRIKGSLLLAEKQKLLQNQAVKKCGLEITRHHKPELRAVSFSLLRKRHKKRKAYVNQVAIGFLEGIEK